MATLARKMKLYLGDNMCRLEWLHQQQVENLSQRRIVLIYCYALHLICCHEKYERTAFHYCCEVLLDKIIVKRFLPKANWNKFTGVKLSTHE